jgi:hypothetical protein
LLSGAFVRFGSAQDGTGLQARMSLAKGSGTATVTHSNLLGSEALVGADANLKTTGAAGRLGWGFSMGGTTLFTPYVGLNSTKAERSAYAETATDDVQAPLSFDAFSLTRSSTQMGVELSGNPAENLTLRVNVALENSRQDLSQFHQARQSLD